MRKTSLLFSLLLLSGCATVPESTTSQLVLMAAANKNNPIDSSSTNAYIPFNISCNNAEGNKLDPKDVLSKVTTEAIKQETGLTPEQIKEAADLLYSGQFRTDIQGIVVLAVSTIPSLAESIPQSGAVIQSKLKSLISNIEDGNINKCVQAILSKNSCSDKLLLHNLLNDLYHDPNNKLIKETLLTLLDNQSFRLALIVYAHSNGLDITQEDLNFVQNRLRKPDVDIGALRDEGEKRLREKYKIEEVEAKLDALNSSCK